MGCESRQRENAKFVQVSVESDLRNAGISVLRVHTAKDFKDCCITTDKTVPEGVASGLRRYALYKGLVVTFRRGVQKK